MLLTGDICPFKPTNQPLHQNYWMSSVVAVKRTVTPEGAHAENLACFAQMSAENVVVLAVPTHSYQTCIMHMMTTIELDPFQRCINYNDQSLY
jgi:hypothetical protein